MTVQWWKASLASSLVLSLLSPLSLLAQDNKINDSLRHVDNNTRKAVLSINNVYAEAAETALKTGDFNTAISQFMQALGRIEQKNESEKLQAAVIAGKLGEAYLGQGNFDKAFGQLKKAYNQVGKLAGDQSLELASILDSLAWVYQTQGNMAKAIVACEQALSIRIAQLAPTKVELAESFEHLGYLYEMQKLWKQAEEQYQKALPIRQGSAAGSHPDPEPFGNIALADLLERIAYVRFMQGNTVQAKADYDQALQIKENTNAALAAYAPQPVDNRVIFRALQGAPNASRGTVNGQLVQKLIANHVMVEASVMQDKGEFSKSTAVHLRVTNRSDRPLQFLSQAPSLVAMKPAVRLLGQLDANQMANRIEQKGQSKAKRIRFFGEGAMTPITTTAWGYNGPAFGYIPPGFGAPPVVWNRRNNWQSQTQTVTTMVPDYQSREEALRRAQMAESASKQQAQQLRDSALGPTTLAPGGSLEGILEFESAKFDESVLRVPIGNSIFELSFN